MRRSKTLAKLRSGQMVRMCSLGHFIPAYLRHAAEFDYDCIWLDMEHRAWSDHEVQALLAFSHLCNVDVMVRPVTLEKSRLYRLLEDGAAGLMIPHVSTPEKARMLVDAVKFPPLGDRGIDGAGLDSDFLFAGSGDYTDAANRETFLVVQIETPQAVENVEAIAAVDGVDALFVGPGDLGLRLQRCPAPFNLDAAVARVAAAAKRHGKAWGQPAMNAAHLQTLTRAGAQLVAHGSEFIAMMRNLEESSRDFDAAAGIRHAPPDSTATNAHVP